MQILKLYRNQGDLDTAFFKPKKLAEHTFADCRIGGDMETRIALIGIIVESTDSIEQLNHLLHEYGSYIIGRMGIPYREKNVNIISVAIDAPQDAINALSGKIGRLSGITAKTVYSNISGKAD